MLDSMLALDRLVGRLDRSSRDASSLEQGAVPSDDGLPLG